METLRPLKRGCMYCFFLIGACFYGAAYTLVAQMIKTNFYWCRSTVVTIYLFIYFQFIYRWQVLFQLTIGLAFRKQQGLSQTSGAINNIAECWYRWHQTFETESQFVQRLKL